jgi:hypothetical protein
MRYLFDRPVCTERPALPWTQVQRAGFAFSALLPHSFKSRVFELKCPLFPKLPECEKAGWKLLLNRTGD